MLRAVLVLAVLASAMGLRFAPLSVRRFSQQRPTALRAGADDNMKWPDPRSAPKLDFDEDFYAVLEVDPKADKAALKKAFYKMVFKYHPDRQEGDEAKALANKQSMVINNAYKVLKEENKRAAYDRQRQSGMYGNAAGKAPPPSSSSWGNQQQSSRQRTTSSTPPRSSSGDYSGGWERRAEEPVESLSDIFGELWGELRRGGASNLLEDLVDFLEDQVPGGTSGVDAGAGARNSRVQTAAELDGEIAVLKTALANLELHLSDLIQLRAKELAALNSSGVGADTKSATVQQLEARLQKVEALRAVDARVETVQKQLRQLQRQLRAASAARGDRPTSSSPSSSSSSSSSTSSATSARPQYAESNPFGPSAPSRPVDPRSGVVDQELNKLKRQMGLK